MPGTHRRPALPAPGRLPEDGYVDLVAVARVLAGEAPVPRLTPGERAEVARALAGQPTRLADVFHVSQTTARTWITRATAKGVAA